MASNELNEAIQRLAVAQATVQRIQKREEQQRIQREKERKRTAAVARDLMLAANLQALMAVDSIHREYGAEEARARSAKWLSGSSAFIEHGSYRKIRLEILDLLVKADLIDPTTDLFRFTPGIIP